MPLLIRQGPASAGMAYPKHDKLEGGAKHAQFGNQDALGLLCVWGRVPPPDVEFNALKGVHSHKDLVKFVSLGWISAD